MEQKENLLGVVKTLFRWKRPIILVGIIAFIGSAAITLALPNYYKATTIFLAGNPDQAQPELLFGRGPFAPQYYGNENDLDRLLTIAESNELIDFLVDTFNLYAHYGIDSTAPKASYKVRQQFYDLYEVTKTKRDAIELSVEDRDRQLAAAIANAAREKIDDIAQRLIKEAQIKVIRSYESSLEQKRQQLAQISDTLMQLRSNFGIYNTEAQSEDLTNQISEVEAKLIRNRTRLEVMRPDRLIPRDSIAFLTAQVKGEEDEFKVLREKVKQLNEGMAIVNILNKQYLEANQTLGIDLERYQLLKAAYQAIIPSTILVERAAVPVVKSRPRRSILVLASVGVVVLLSLIGVLLFEQYKEINWREIIDAK